MKKLNIDTLFFNSNEEFDYDYFGKKLTINEDLLYRLNTIGEKRTEEEKERYKKAMREAAKDKYFTKILVNPKIEKDIEDKDTDYLFRYLNKLKNFRYKFIEGEKSLSELDDIMQENKHPFNVEENFKILFESEWF